MARLHGGHRGVIKEGLVILVSQRPAWGRALISTNRFLIRASRALQHPLPVHLNTHWRAHTCTGRSPVSKPSKRGIILPGLCHDGKNILSFRKMEPEACTFQSGTNNCNSLASKREKPKKTDGRKHFWGQCTVLPAQEMLPMMHLPPVLKPDSLIMASSPSQLAPLSTSSPDAA